MRNLILSGGVAHNYLKTSRMLEEILKEVNVISDIEEDLGILETEKILTYDVLTMNNVRWSCSQVDPRLGWKEKWEFIITDKMQQGLLKFLSFKKGLMALHAAAINFDTWPEFGNVLAGIWEWGKTTHAPYQPGWKMSVIDKTHPITRDINDFEIYDELYYNLTMKKDVRVLINTLYENKTYPIAWVTEYNSSRIYYNGLGHGPETFENPVFRKLLQQGIKWAGRDDR